MGEYRSRVSPKGQVTIPQEIRRRFGLKPRDIVAIRVENGEIRITPLVQGLGDLAASFQAVPPLRQPYDADELARIAGEEHAGHAAREGLPAQPRPRHEADEV